MSKIANETTQPTKAPLWREARYAGQTWREESSDIKLESTKGSEGTQSRPEGFISYSEGIRGTRLVLVRRFAPNWNPTLQFLGRSRMTRKCHVRICRRARRHNEGLSLTTINVS